MVIDELFLILLINNLVSFALGQRIVDILDGFEADGLGLLGEIHEQLLRLHVH